MKTKAFLIALALPHVAALVLWVTTFVNPLLASRDDLIPLYLWVIGLSLLSSILGVVFYLGSSRTNPYKATLAAAILALLLNGYGVLWTIGGAMTVGH